MNPHFPADINKLVSSMRENGVRSEELCEVDAFAKWYAKNLRETPVNRGLQGWQNILKRMKFKL